MPHRYKDKPDLPAKDQKITCAADMTVIERDVSDDFLVLCCDGIYDVMTNEQVHEFIVNHLKVRPPASQPRFSHFQLGKT